MAMEEVLIDADGHILEPPDLWEKYLEPKYRDRAIRIKRGDDGREYLEIDNKVSALTSPTLLASLGGMKKLQELGATVEDVNAKRRDLLKARSGEKHRVFDSLEGVETVESYVGGAAYGAMDAKERLALLDTDCMAKTILYPTIGLLWEAELFDADLSDAYCRAYNRWIADFCRDSGGRLVPIAHISLGDPAEAARELERAVKDGCRGAFVCPFTITRVPHGDKQHDAVFAAAQDLDVPLAIHPTFEPASFGIHHRYDNFSWAAWYFDLFAGQGVQHAFGTFFQLGVFDRFPKLRTVVLESQAG